MGEREFGEEVAEAYLEFATASSPMKKSRSSMPRLEARWEGLLATAGPRAFVRDREQDGRERRLAVGRRRAEMGLR